jgi:hypothetical protein
MPRSLGLGVAMAIVLSTGVSSGQTSYRLAPIGGRSQLLGGTGIVYGRDASASFLNPATAVLVDDQRLSFSVNFYRFTYANASDWWAPGPVDTSRFGNIDVRRTSLASVDFDILPSSLCFYFVSSRLQLISSAEPAHVGFCFATIESAAFNFAAQDFSEVRANGSVTRQAQTISQNYSQFAAGPTYAFRVNDTLSLGASVHAGLTNHRSLLSASATTYGTPTTPITSSFYAASTGTAFQLEGTLGGTMRFGKQTVGLSVRTPSLHIAGTGGVNRDTTYAGSGGATDQLSATGSFTATSPLRIGIGTGAEGVWGQLEVNAFYFHELGSTYRAQLGGHEVTTTGGPAIDKQVNLDVHQHSSGVVDLAIGAELFMSERISLLLGLSNDVSAVRSQPLAAGPFNYFGYGADRISSSVGIGTHGGNGELDVGAELTYGWGERLAVNSYQLPPVLGSADYKTFEVMIIVAGSTSLPALKKAVDEVKKVVVDPAPLKPVNAPKPQQPLNTPSRQKPLEVPLP